MDPNQIFFFMLSGLNPYSQQANIPLPKFPVKPVTPQVKYRRTWKKDQIEEVFSEASKYSQQQNKNIEDLTIRDFEIISSRFEQSTEQVMAKVNEINKSGTLRPGIWSVNEDELLISVLNKGIQKWGQMASVLNREIHKGIRIRTGKQCKERWNNYLNPLINRQPWTDKEDVLALENYKVHGNKWSLISKSIKNRTESSIKNRIKSLINKIKQDLDTMDDINIGIDRVIAKKNEDISKEQTTIKNASDNSEIHKPELKTEEKNL